MGAEHAGEYLGISIPVCPACGRFNPHDVGTAPPTRCHACQAPMLPACPEHGEAGCDKGCPSRPCANCGGSGPVPSTIDPFKWNQGLLCRTCGREKIDGGERGHA